MEEVSSMSGGGEGERGVARAPRDHVFSAGFPLSHGQQQGAAQHQAQGGGNLDISSNNSRSTNGEKNKHGRQCVGEEEVDSARLDR